MSRADASQTHSNAEVFFDLRLATIQPKKILEHVPKWTNGRHLCIGLMVLTAARTSRAAAIDEYTLEMSKLSEAQIKLLIVSGAMKLKPRFIVTEVAFANYQARADILIGFGRLLGIEVKTANDRFDRLPAQMANYASSFHASYVAYPAEVRKKIPDSLSKSIGLIEIANKECRLVRKARSRRHVHPRFLNDMARGNASETEQELLWRIETRFRKNYRAFLNSIGSSPLEEDMKLLATRRTEIETRVRQAP